MFLHKINPVLLDAGPFSIRYYGLVYVLGFLFLYFFLKKQAQKHKIKNLTEENAETFILYLILGLIIGARLFEVLVYHPLFYLNNPLEILMIWHGGLSFHGGLAGAVVSAIIFCRKHKVRFYELADAVIIPAAIFLALGRIANFINAENIGTLTNVAWCVQFPTALGCRHPVQLYEALKNLIIFGILFLIYRRKTLPKGAVFWLFWLLYGVLRFLVTFLREDERFLGLSLGQYLCIAMIAASIIFLAKIYRNYKREKKKTGQRPARKNN